MSRKLLPVLLLATPAAAPGQDKISWQDHIRPIFENRCNNCHNADKKRGDLDLSSYAGVMAGGSGGASVEAGDSAASTLWKVVSHTAEPVMPPKGGKIPDAEIGLIAKWIQGGLLETPDGTAKVKKKASFAMAATASHARPEGPPPMPGPLLLDPVVTPARPNAAISVAHSPWAPLTAVAAPRQVLLYHSGTGDLLGVLPFPEEGTPETVSFSRNGGLVLAGGGIPGKKGLVAVWDIKTGLPVIQLPVTEDADTILAADISADLSKIATGGPGRRVRIFDTRTQQQLASIKKHTDWVTALAFSPDGVLLATGDRNGGLYVWEAGTGNEFHNLRAHEKMISALAWRGDSNLLAAGSEDGSMTWWEMANGTQVKKIASHGGVLALGFAPDGRLVSGGRDGHARLWDGNGTQQRDWVPSGGHVILETIFSDDGQRVLTGSWDGELKSWSTADKDKDAPPVPLILNPPAIETRIARLDGEIPVAREAAAKAAAVQAEAEKSLTAHTESLGAARARLAALPQEVQAATARVTGLQAALTKLGEARVRFEKEKAETVKALAAATSTSASVPSGGPVAEGSSPPAPPGPEVAAAGPVPPAPAPAAPETPPAPAASRPAEVQAALDEAGQAEVSIASLSRAVLEKKEAALTQALAGCAQSEARHGAELAAATATATRLQAELETLTKDMPDREKAGATLRQQAEAAQAGTAAAQAKAAETSRALARWQAARILKNALTLQSGIRALREKQEALRTELESLEAGAAVTTLPAGTAPATPEALAATAARAETLRRELETVSSRIEPCEKEAAAAMAEYEALLPK